MNGIEPQAIVFGLSVFLFGIGLAVYRIPVDECPQCDHCRAERTVRLAAREAERRLDGYQGLEPCPKCGRIHGAGGPPCT